MRDKPFIYWTATPYWHISKLNQGEQKYAIF